MAREILTAYDVVEACGDWLGMGNYSPDLRRIKRAMVAALAEVQQAVPSAYMQKMGRLHFAAPQTDGTVQYTHSTRLLTLTDSTWPSTAIDYAVLVDDKWCDIEARVSDTVVRLDVNLNPGEDVAAGTSYTLAQRYYRLPDDFAETDEFWSESVPALGIQVSMSQLAGMNRYYAGTGTPRCWAIGGIQDQMGSRGLFIYPPADSAMTQDYIYRRRTRELRHTGHATAEQAGTIAASAGSTTVTGSGTSFSSTMVGSMLRVGANSGSAVPTGLSGKDPCTYERMIHSVDSTTSLTVDRAFSSTVAVASAKIVVTDPVDIDPMLYDLFLTRCYMELANQMDESVMQNIVANYNQKLHQARCAVFSGSQIQSPLVPRLVPGMHFVISSTLAED